MRYYTPMISVIIECRNQEKALAGTLAALVPGAVEGLVAEVVIIDRGSTDRTEALADAAGCRFIEHGGIGEVIRAARGEWLLFIEPGARPLPGWIEYLHQYLMSGQMAARFSPARAHRLPFLSRIRRRPSPLQYGALVPKRQALAKNRADGTVEGVVRGLAMRKLRCEMAPAAALDRKDF